MARAFLRRTKPATRSATLAAADTTSFSEISPVYLAHAHQAADVKQAAPELLRGLLAHLDAVYGFALTLTGDAELAAGLTEEVFASAWDELWATLGGDASRDRLLARCVSVFAESFSWRTPAAPATAADARPHTSLHACLRELPWNERAAIALVDQLGLTYAGGAAVMGIERAEFRTLLHRGRSVLLSDWAKAAGRRCPPKVGS